MTFLNKTLATVTASFIVIGGAAFADGHQLNVGTAAIDLSLDTDGNSEVTTDEIIEGNMAFFDQDGDGTIDAAERGVAEQQIMSGGIIEMMPNDGMAQAASFDFDADTARLDLSLDTNNDGMVSDDEIIDGNQAIFDTNNDGTLDAAERGVIEQSLMGSGSVEVEATGTSGDNMNFDFDADAARLDMMLDQNGDGEISDSELIEGNAALFDTNNDGVLEADERGAAEAFLMTQ